MRFQTKVFLASFISCAAALTLLTISTEETLRESLARDYRDRYETLGQVIGTTLRQMEDATARISQVAVQGLGGRVQSEGVLSEEALVNYRRALGISQLVITDRDGTILRDTETAPADRTAKLFDFCEGYRGLLKKPGVIETTPVLPSFPSGQSFLFSMMSRPAGVGIVEAGMHVSFIVDTLKRALASDPNIRAVALYTPGGIPLGAVGEDAEAKTKAPLPGLKLGTFPMNEDRLSIVTEVPAASADCCECRKKGLVDAGGRYFYFLRTEVSLAALTANQKILRERTALFFALSLALAALLSFVASVQVVRRLRRFQEGVERIGSSGKLGDRLKLEGRDEVGALAETFNTLSARLEESQRRALELERSRVLTEMATRVAHDIRSPLAVLKSLDRDSARGPEHRLLGAAIERIQKIAQDLLDTHRVEKQAPSRSRAAHELIEETIALKRREVGAALKGSVTFHPASGTEAAFLILSESHFGRVLSNLLNNSLEATKNAGEIRVELSSEGEKARITVRDNGPGIPAARLAQLRAVGGTFGKEKGLGLGLLQAKEVAQGAGGSLEIDSVEGRGTAVSLIVPRAKTPAWFVESLPVRGTIIIVDDDPSVHRAWEERLLSANSGLEIRHVFSLAELRAETWPNDATFLIDQQLGAGAETGIDAILSLGIAANSVLVTSYAEEASLQELCEREGVRLLDKAQIASIELKA